MENKIQIVDAEDSNSDRPRDPFDGIDAMDDRLIMEEIKGRIVDEWVYHFKDENGREQWGLSKVGVDAACSELAKRGEVIRELEIRHDIDPTDKEYILFTAKAGRYAVSRDGKEVLLDTAFGTKRQSTVVHRRDGSTSYNNFWFEQGAAKALRNARNRLIGEEMRTSIIAFAREHNKTANLSPRRSAPAQPQQPQKTGSGSASQNPSQKDNPISDAQKRMLHAQMKRLGISFDQLKARFQIENLENMSVRQASSVITALGKMKTWS